jgi:opacity protein-like surface antigen
MLRDALSVGVLVFLLVAFSGAQDAGQSRDLGHFDASINWGGVFSKTSSSNLGGNVTVAPTNSTLVLGTFHFLFGPTHGLEFNIGHTDDSQIYILSPDNYRLQTSITEYTAAYVLTPYRFRRIEPFLLAGGGALRFYPGKTFIDGFQNAFPAYTQTSLAFLYGGGADFPIWRGLALRLQYRGLIYKEPTLRIQEFFTGARGHMAEPTAGIVVRF